GARDRPALRPRGRDRDDAAPSPAGVSASVPATGRADGTAPRPLRPSRGRHRARIHGRASHGDTASLRSAPRSHMTLSPRDRTFTVIGILLAMFLGAIHQTIVATPLPSIVADLA